MANSNFQKRVILSILILAFAQKEIALASTLSLPLDSLPDFTSHKKDQTPKQMPAVMKLPAPLVAARITDEAAPLIQIAQARSLNEYFGTSNSINDPAILVRFDADLEKVLHANVMIGFANDADRFRAWYPPRKAELMLSRGLMGADVNLQSYFANVFLKFKADMAQEDTSVFTKWLEQQLNNDKLKMVSDPTFWLIVGTAVFMKDIVKGATIAGPLGGIVSAFVEPIVRPIREKVVLIGARLFTGWGTVLTRVLFSEPKAKSTGDESIKKAQQAQRETISYLNSLGFDMTPTQFSETTSKLQDAWNQYNQVWLTTEPGSYQLGRDKMTDSLMLRMQSFSNTIFNAHQLVESYRHGIETSMDRVVAKNPGQAAAIEKARDVLFDKMEAHFLIDKANGAALQGAAVDVEKAKQELLRLGVAEPVLTRIENAQKQIMIASRHAATSAASFVFHELKFKEFNRRLPAELYERYQFMRQNFGLDFYTKLYAKEIVSILGRLGVQLSVLEVVKKDIDLSAKRNSAMEKVSKVNDAPANVRTLDRIGEGRTMSAEERRVRDAVGKASKK